MAYVPGVDRHGLDLPAPREFFDWVARGDISLVRHFADGSLSGDTTYMRVLLEEVLDASLGITKDFFIKLGKLPPKFRRTLSEVAKERRIRTQLGFMWGSVVTAFFIALGLFGIFGSIFGNNKEWYVLLAGGIMFVLVGGLCIWLSLFSDFVKLARIRRLISLCQETKHKL
jgi:hypothetical protein